jgi:hypothetical protein
MDFFIMDKINTIDRDFFHKLIHVVRWSRDWVRREQDRYDIHPTIVKLMLDVVRPKDWHRVVLEWPHVSLSDPSRVAYTRDNKSGETDRQVVTSLGKYIRERWDHSDLPDHVLRAFVDDYVVRHTNSCEWLEQDVYEYIHAVQNGPNSCMRWDAFDSDEDQSYHPYRCYDPKYGWRMAVRRNGSKDIVGRALALEHPDFGKVYVRTFKAENDNPHGGGYSHSDEKLAAFLESEGYKHQCCYPEGAKLYTRALRSGEYLGPYMDGETHHAMLHQHADGEYYFVLDDDGEFSLRETNGRVEERERSTCDCCGARFDDDDLRTVGIHEDSRVCEGCIDSDYTYVEHANRWGGAYIHNDDVFESVEGDTLTDSSHCLQNYTYLDCGQHEGLYTHDDNAVCDVNGEYWHTDDIGGDLVCLCEGSTHSGEYIDADDAIKDIDDNYWHEDDVGADITQVDAGIHEGEYVCTDDTVTDSNGTIWHTDDVDVHIKQSALDPTVYVAIDQLEITEGETK